MEGQAQRRAISIAVRNDGDCFAPLAMTGKSELFALHPIGLDLSVRGLGLHRAAAALRASRRHADARVRTDFFGRGMPGRPPLTDQEWTQFAADVVTPNLPDGFTALVADGQWQNPATRRISQERTKVIIVAVPDTPAAAAAIAAVKEAYRTRFHQQSVGTTIHPVCGAF